MSLADVSSSDVSISDAQSSVGLDSGSATLSSRDSSVSIGDAGAATNEDSGVCPANKEDFESSFEKNLITENFN